jgi:leucyl/phenylalanyl-tRNA---protein transferase
MNASDHPDPVTPDILLRAYCSGLFPMAEDAEDEHLHWFDPRERGIFPLDAMVVSRSLAKKIRAAPYEISADRDFAQVLSACASSAPGREKTWINKRIVKVFHKLHELGYGHSIEAWRDGELVGGLYGLAIGGAFFGESMFHRATDASKICLIHLVARLRRGGFLLLDAQFLTPHLESLGAIEISRADYRRRLSAALHIDGDFHALDAQAWDPETILALARPTPDR